MPRSPLRRLVLGTASVALGACAPTALLQSPDALPRGDWEIALGAGGSIAGVDGDEPELEIPAVDLAWRVGVSDVTDVSVRGFYGGGGIGLYADVKAEVMSGPIWVSPIFGASVAADLDGGASFAAAPGFMVGNKQIWAAPRALVGTASGRGVSTGFGLGVGGSYGGAVRVMPEANLFYLPADFEQDDLYVGFTIGLAYRRSNELPAQFEEDSEEGAEESGPMESEVPEAQQDPESQPMETVPVLPQYPDDDPYP